MAMSQESDGGDAFGGNPTRQAMPDEVTSQSGRSFEPLTLILDGWPPNTMSPRHN
jgi:hypothetical protein